MPFNGTGTYVRNYNWTSDATNGILVRSDRFDGQDNDFATALSNCVTKDGQQTTTALVPFSQGISIPQGLANTPGLAVIGDTSTGFYQTALGNLVFTSVGVAITTLNATGISTTGNLTAPTIVSVPVTTTGSANVYVYTSTQTIALTSGLRLTIIPNFVNTGAATINVNTLGAKNIYYQSPTGPAALQGSELQLNQVVELVYDGTEFQLISPNPASASSALSFKNRTINGDMRIDQRNNGASQTITAGTSNLTNAYTVDRFYAACTNANVTGQRVAGSSPDQYAYQFTGATSVSGIAFGQRYEATNVYDLASKTATFSVKLANSLLTTVTWTAYYPTSTDTWSGRTQISTGTFTVSSTIATYSTQISLPSNITNGLQIELTVGNQTSGTWTIADWQLESGNVATSFERLPIQVQLAECQRYFWYLNNAVFVQFYCQTNGQQSSVPIQFPVNMRTTPTVTAVVSGGSNANGGSVFNIGTSGFCYLVNGAATTGQTALTYNAGNTATAEL